MSCFVRIYACLNASELDIFGTCETVAIRSWVQAQRSFLPMCHQRRNLQRLRRGCIPDCWPSGQCSSPHASSSEDSRSTGFSTVPLRLNVATCTGWNGNLPASCAACNSFRALHRRFAMKALFFAFALSLRVPLSPLSGVISSRLQIVKMIEIAGTSKERNQRQAINVHCMHTLAGTPQRSGRLCSAHTQLQLERQSPPTFLMDMHM